MGIWYFLFGGVLNFVGIIRYVYLGIREEMSLEVDFRRFEVGSLLLFLGGFGCFGEGSRWRWRWG